MDWFTDNAVANMYGPRFLVLYAIVIAITLGICWLVLTSRTHARAREEEEFFGHDEERGLRTGWDSSSGDLGVRLAGGFVIVGLGGYKLVVALSKGKSNVLFLLLLCGFSLFVLFTMCRLTGQERRGR